MSRSIDPPTLAALQATVVRPALLVECDFAGGFLRVWSGVGNLVVGADTFTGVGTLGGISPVEEAADVSSRGITLSLSGVPSPLIGAVLDDDFRGRRCTIWLGCFDEEHAALVGDPLIIFRGQMDTCEIDDNGATSEIRLQVESRLALLRRPRTRRLTHEQQIARHPGDTGLEYISKLAERPIHWGIPTPAPAAAAR